MRFDDTILPIPIRRDVVVRVQGLPLDLTRAEADRLGAIVMAMAAPQSIPERKEP